MRLTRMINDRQDGDKNYRSVRYLCLTLLLLVALTATFSLPSWAANVGGNIPISVKNGTAEPPLLLSDDQQNPSIIALPDKNKWFVVWEDWRNWDKSGADIYGRFINNDGTLCGDEIAISTQPGNQTVPVLDYRNRPDSDPQTLGEDKIMVAWQDTRGGTTSGFIYYEIIDISLMASDSICPDTEVSLTSTVDSEGLHKGVAIGYKSIGSDKLTSRKLPDIAYDNTRDQFWLVWVESRDKLQRVQELTFGNNYRSSEWSFGDSNYVAYGAVSALSGNAQIPEILRNVGTSPVRTVRRISSSFVKATSTYIYEYFTNINNVTVACDDSSPEALIAWEGVRGKATLTCSWTDSEAVWQLSDTSSCEEGDAGCTRKDSEDEYDQYDTYSNTFTTEHDSGGTTDGMVHVYSIFDKYILQGVVHTQLIDSSDSPSYYPTLGYDSIHRKFLAAWEDRGVHDEGTDGVHSNIYGQLIYSGGGLYGSNLAISYQDLNADGTLDEEIKTTNQTRPDISVDTTNQRFLVTWQDARNSSVSLENLDIYGQFIDSEGSLRGNNYAICVENANQYNPITAYNPTNHKFLTVWKDARNLNTTNSDIYGQLFTLGQPQLILLGEDGTQLIPPLINFPALEIGQSNSVVVSMLNAGDSVIAIDGVTGLQDPFAYVNLTGEFVDPDDGVTIDLLPGSSIPLTVEFKPTQVGVFVSKFTIHSDSTDLTVNLQGQAGQVVPPDRSEVTVVPTSLNFGSVILKETASLSLLFKNGGKAAATIESFNISAGFSVVGLSGAIDPGGELVAVVSFTPDQPRSYSGLLRVFYDDGGVSEITLYASGNGNIIARVKPPGNVNFGNAAVGDSKSASLLFSNTGNVDVVITAIDLPGIAFSVSGIPGTVPAYGTLSALATFSPTLPQAYATTLRVLYDHNLATSEIVLSGVGVYNVDNIIDVADEIVFTNTNIGEITNSNLRFINKGSVDVKIEAVDLPDGVFSVSGIPGTVPAYGVLDALVGFTPLFARNYKTTMRVVYDHGVPTDNIKLSGLGVDLALPAVTVVPQSFSFGRVALGTEKTENLVITNSGNVDLEIVAIDLPDSRFSVKGLVTGTLAEGMSKVVTVTFIPDVVTDYSTTMRILFDHDLPSYKINLQGSGTEIDVSPAVLDFPNSEIDSSTILNVTITNGTDHDLQVKGAVTGGEPYSVSGIAKGDIVRSAGGTLTCQVTFAPTDSGYFEDGLYFSIGPVQDVATPFEEIDWGTPYMVILRGTANADFVVTDIDSFTADQGYKMSISASTNQSGEVFVVFSHDPLSSGDIYALTNDGTLQPFPYEASFGWQNLWYIDSTYPGLKLDLSKVDFRPLGCSECIGTNSDGTSNFGKIKIDIPSKKDFNNASDFKYMSGTLYLGTYIKDASKGGVFNFNKGLLEMQSLDIHSLAGTWQVTSCYYGENRVHPSYLVVTEPGDGQISAVWPGYNPTLNYIKDGTGYVMTFSLGGYDYTYKITDLSEDKFTGTYSCIANGVLIVDDELVSGVRLK